jgi:hypothetical protein
MALLDRPNWRHALHLWTHKGCGRCQEEASARWHDEQLNAAGRRSAAGPLSLALTPESEAIE